MINEKIKSAIETAVASEQQPAELSKKITAWIENLMEGNEDIADASSFTQRCDLCFDTTILPITIEE
ncbi:MAG: CxC ATPase DNA modification system associated small protein [Bacteroidota bacterium]